MTAKPRTTEELLAACERVVAEWGESPPFSESVTPTHESTADQARRILVLEAQVTQLMRMLEEVPLMVRGMIGSGCDDGDAA